MLLSLFSGEITRFVYMFNKEKGGEGRKIWKYSDEKDDEIYCIWDTWPWKFNGPTDSIARSNGFTFVVVILW